MPDLVVEHPRLVGDRLDHVIAVEVLQRFEEVEGAARAAGPAHVHVDHGEAHQVGEHGDAVFRAGRVRVAVARVFDQRRVRRRVARRRHAGCGKVGKWKPDGTPGSPAGLVGGWTSIASWVPSRVVR